MKKRLSITEIKSILSISILFIIFILIPKSMIERKSTSKDDRTPWFVYVFLISMLWVSISTAIQAWECSAMTEMELLKRIPHSFITDWITCEAKSYD